MIGTTANLHSSRLLHSTSSPLNAPLRHGCTASFISQDTQSSVVDPSKHHCHPSASNLEHKWWQSCQQPNQRIPGRHLSFGLSVSTDLQSGEDALLQKCDLLAHVCCACRRADATCFGQESLSSDGVQPCCERLECCCNVVRYAVSTSTRVVTVEIFVNVEDEVRCCSVWVCDCSKCCSTAV